MSPRDSDNGLEKKKHLKDTHPHPHPHPSHRIAELKILNVHENPVMSTSAV